MMQDVTVSGNEASKWTHPVMFPPQCTFSYFANSCNIASEAIIIKLKARPICAIGIEDDRNRRRVFYEDCL